MRDIVILFLVIGMLFSASFSLVMMNHMDNQVHSLCPFEAAGVTNCTRAQISLISMVSHLNALSRFFSAVPVADFSNLISLLFLLVLATITTLGKPDLIKLNPLSVKSRLNKSFVPIQKNLFVDWFALHENSPALS